MDYGKIDMLEFSIFHDIPDDNKHFYVDNFFYKENEKAFNNKKRAYFPLDLTYLRREKS